MVCDMMYPYITLSDETIITHSQILNKNGKKTVEVHFERPRDDGDFDMARCSLPTYEWVIKKGYNIKEMEIFEHLVRNGTNTFFKYAEIGGMNVAKAV